MVSVMADYLAGHAITFASKTAVVDDRPGEAPVIWTYAQLNEQANRLAHVLQSLGVGHGTKVVCAGQNSAGWIRQFHAARKVGATHVPLNYRLSDEESAYVIDNCDATVVSVDAPYAAMIERIRADIPKVEHVVVFDADRHGLRVPTGMLDGDVLIATASTDEPIVPEAPEVAATMIYTSGTTGKPKGAVRRNAANPEQTGALLALMKWNPDLVYLTTGPLYHSGPGGFMGIAAALGNTVVVQYKFDAQDWLRLTDTYGVSTTFAAPTPIRMICALSTEIKSRYNRSTMKLMVANAAPWSFALKEAYLADFPEDSLYEVYGSTELGVNCVLEPADQRRKPGSCGKPAPFVEVRLLDDDGNEVTGTGPEHPGELFARSSSTFSTYYKAQEKYDADRRGDWHTVGDIAYRDDEGYLYICDRKKDMIISGGVNIYPAEIESALEAHPEIFDVAVFGVPSEEWGEAVHAIIVTTPGSALDGDGVVAFAREHLAGYKVPRTVSFLPELPRTGSGKILKRELRAPFWAGHSRMVG
jgi:acyl-CoA synthetase (AMP-forming)/AMP-acid ligase II